MKRHLCILIALLTLVIVSAQEGIRLPEKPSNRTEYKDFSLQESGYWTAVELNAGSTVMFSRKNMQPISVDWVNGYRINEFLRFGIGVGVKYFINNDRMRATNFKLAIPVYLDVRGNFVSHQDREAVPYWALDIGGEFKGGLLVSPTIGYRIGTPRSSFTLGLNYTLSQYDTWKKYNEFISTLAIKLGYEF